MEGNAGPVDLAAHHLLGIIGDNLEDYREATGSLYRRLLMWRMTRAMSMTRDAFYVWRVLAGAGRLRQ